MYKYFLLKNRPIETSVSPEQISLYRDRVIDEMKKMGATNHEIELLKRETILNSIRNKRDPEDVAWAILQ